MVFYPESDQIQPDTLPRTSSSTVRPTVRCSRWADFSYTTVLRASEVRGALYNSVGPVPVRPYADGVCLGEDLWRAEEKNPRRS